MKKTIEFDNKEIELTVFIYNGGRTGILMIDLETGGFHGPATLQMECNVGNNEVLIKSWDHNYGLYEVLLKENIVKPFRRKLSIGMNEAHICELTDSFKKVYCKT